MAEPKSVCRLSIPLVLLFLAAPSRQRRHRVARSPKTSRILRFAFPYPWHAGPSSNPSPNRSRCVVGARVAPSLEKMGLGNMPVTELRCLIVIQAKSNAQLDPEKMFCEFEIRRRGIDRISAQDEKRVHLASLHVLN